VTDARRMAEYDTCAPLFGNDFSAAPSALVQASLVCVFIHD
jgi:hypothetical protein